MRFIFVSLLLTDALVWAVPSVHFSHEAIRHDRDSLRKVVFEPNGEVRSPA